MVGTSSSYHHSVTFSAFIQTQETTILSTEGSPLNYMRGDSRNCHIIYNWRFSIESGARWVQGRRAGLLCTLIITSISPRSYHTVIPLPAPIKTIKVASVMKTNGHLVKVKIITAPSSVITANCSIVNMGLVELHSPQNNHKTSRIWRLLRPYVATKLYSASQDWRVDRGHATNQV